MVPQQWLGHTSAPGVAADDRRRLDMLVYGATPMGIALCCDATLVSPLTRTGQPQPCAADTDGAALRVAERRKQAAYPELTGGGPQRLVVLGSEVGGRWNGGALRFMRDMVRIRACREPPTGRRAAASGWARRPTSLPHRLTASWSLGRPTQAGCHCGHSYSPGSLGTA